MIDPTGYILTTIRDNVGVAALTDRIRASEPVGKVFNAAGVLIDEGDVRGAGKYVRFVVLVRLGSQREKRLPMQEVRYSARCYGQGISPARDAAALAGAVSDAIHGLRPRISSGGIGIWASFDDGGDGAAKDPVTDQPYESVVISVTAADRLLV